MDRLLVSQSAMDPGMIQTEQSVWKIEFYTTLSGSSPVSEFIKQLPILSQAKTRNLLRFLRDFGPQLRQPYSKKLTGYKNLFELRSSGKNPVRLIYGQLKDGFMILHAFVKKSQKTPQREIETAQRRLSSLT